MLCRQLLLAIWGSVLLSITCQYCPLSEEFVWNSRGKNTDHPLLVLYFFLCMSVIFIGTFSGIRSVMVLVSNAVFCVVHKSYDVFNYLCFLTLIWNQILNYAWLRGVSLSPSPFCFDFFLGLKWNLILQQQDRIIFLAL